MLHRLFREPLLQFLLIGLLLFVVYGIVSGGKWHGERRIVIDVATVSALSERFEALWQRRPTPAELKGLIDSYLSDEVRYREGLALGLDKNDPVVRRRVLQKLEVISEESNRRSPPTDVQLQAYLQVHAERYALPGKVGLDQILFDPAHHGAALQAHLDAALKRLRAGAAPSGIGDPSLLPAHLEEVPVDQVARDFGEEFTAAVADLPVGTWQGPVRSAYGLHLVRVAARLPGRPATLSESRAALARDYENDQRLRTAQQYEQRLRKNFDIVFETQAPGSPGEAAAP